MGYRSNQNDCCHLWAGSSLGEWKINNFGIFKRFEWQKYKRKWIWKSWRSKDITILSIKNTYTPGYRLLFQRRMIWGLEQHKNYINTVPPIHWLAFKNEKSINSPTQVEMDRSHVFECISSILCFLLIILFLLLFISLQSFFVSTEFSVFPFILLV